MKIKLIAVGMTIFLLGGLFLPSFSQDVSRLKADYFFNLDNYRLKEDQFIKAQENFYNFRNLASKTQALTAEKEILLARNEVLRTYFILLKEMLLSSKIQGVNTQSIEKHLTTTILTLEEESNLIQNTDSIEELNQLSTKIEEKKSQFISLFQLVKDIIYFNKLSEYFFGCQDISEELLDELKEKIGESNKDFISYKKEIVTKAENLSSLWLELNQQLLSSAKEDNLSFYRNNQGGIQMKMENFKASLLDFMSLNYDILNIAKWINSR